MEILVGACLVLITLALWIGLAVVAITALQVKRTAEAVEIKVYQIGEQFHRLEDAASAASHFAGILRSPWVKGLGLALGAATTLFTVRSRRAAAAEYAGRNGE